ncbi:MAG TPA: Mfa1 family fimbria major subunit [Bacteroides reticulotermitis]|nr:Mfa1 family fimbria major subunit [Bacteroides reticulotermitis]
MMKNFKYAAMMAAALTLSFSSCSNNEDLGNEGIAVAGSPTKMTLAITQPSTYAADGNATGDEVSIKTVDVYIYSGTTFVKRQSLSVAAGDFVQDGTDPAIWKLASGKEIATTTGSKTIYVGVNLSATLADAIAGTDPAAIAQTIADASQLQGVTGFAMFSREGKTADLVAVDDSDYPTKNTVKVGVARLLAKVVVKQGAGLLNTDITGGVLHDLEFTVSNVNTKFFPLPSTTFVDPNHTSPWSMLSEFIAGTSYEGVNASSASVTTANAIYTTENTSAGDLQGEHTYVSVRGTFVPTTINGWDGTDLTTETGIAKGDTFYKVVVNGKSYFFSDATQAADYASDKSSTLVEYTNGLAYYNVFLNPKPDSGKEMKFDVLRNTIYTVNITKINGLGDGEDPLDPTDPIDGPTNLSVEIDIEDWAMKSQDSELTGK